MLPVVKVWRGFHNIPRARFRLRELIITQSMITRFPCNVWCRNIDGMLLAEGLEVDPRRCLKNGQGLEEKLPFPKRIFLQCYGNLHVLTPMQKVIGYDTMRIYARIYGGM